MAFRLTERSLKEAEGGRGMERERGRDEEMTGRRETVWHTTANSSPGT